MKSYFNPKLCIPYPTRQSENVHIYIQPRHGMPLCRYGVLLALHPADGNCVSIFLDSHEGGGGHLTDFWIHPHQIAIKVLHFRDGCYQLSICHDGNSNKFL